MPGLRISIHAPTRGATPEPASRHPTQAYFNPRSHKGSDVGPGREASGSVPDFNPRSHKGSDDKFWRVETVRKNFNPRSHKGSDKGDVSVVLPAGDFNPRSHKGSDGTDRFIQVRNTISIHAPTRGATTFPPARYGHPGRFQSTLPQGERLKNSVGNRLGMNFNPRSHKGSDNMSYNFCKHSWTFQSTLPQGERQLYSAYILSNILYFNPRSHKGSDRGCGLSLVWFG